MSVSVVITNLAATPTKINELYTTLGAAGSTTAAVTIQRSVAQLDSMTETKSLLAAGTISVVATNSADNADLMSIPMEQHGVQAALSVASVAVVSSAVTFAKPFPAGVKPVVICSTDKTNGPTSRSTLYIESVTNTGFTIKLDVTVLQAASTVDINWIASY